jgi:hypothetical protein
MRSYLRQHAIDVGASPPSLLTDITVVRSLHPEIDSIGFESYLVRCGCSESVLGGIVDPIDDTFLVSLLELPSRRRIDQPKDSVMAQETN